jgi:hypothetical protein
VVLGGLNEKGLKNGVPDLAWIILSFYALVSRCMTHGGVNSVYIEETRHFLKEFMSCLFEFDILVQFRFLNVAGKEEEDRSMTGKAGTKTAGKKEKKEGQKLEACTREKKYSTAIVNNEFLLSDYYQSRM